MRYLDARMNSDIRERNFRYYVANSIQGIPENKYIPATLYEIDHPQPEDNRDAGEIILDVMKRGGLVFAEDTDHQTDGCR